MRGGDEGEGLIFGAVENPVSPIVAHCNG